MVQMIPIENLNCEKSADYNKITFYEKNWDIHQLTLNIFGMPSI